MVSKFASKNSKYFYFIFRIIVGAVFFMHGAQKLFGWFGGNKVPILTQFGAAGLIETVGGLLIVLGLFTQWTALITALEMLYAYLFMHVANGGIIPLINKGEASLLYFAAFLVLFAYGAGIWALDNKLKKRNKK